MLFFYAEVCGLGFFHYLEIENTTEVSVGLETKVLCRVYLDCALYRSHFRIKCCSGDHLALVADVGPNQSACEQ